MLPIKQKFCDTIFAPNARRKTLICAFGAFYYFSQLFRYFNYLIIKYLQNKVFVNANIQIKISN
jgi:hypothetical protein